MTEKLNEVEKQKSQLEERVGRLQIELKELKHVAAEKDQLESRVKRLEAELSKAEDTSRQFQSEMQRLRALDSQLKQALDTNERKEKDILRLIATNSELETNYETMSREFNRERAEFKETLENITNRNAEIEGECNLMRKRLSDLNETIEAMNLDFSQKVPSQFEIFQSRL